MPTYNNSERPPQYSHNEEEFCFCTLLCGDCTYLCQEDWLQKHRLTIFPSDLPLPPPPPHWRTPQHPPWPPNHSCQSATNTHLYPLPLLTTAVQSFTTTMSRLIMMNKDQCQRKRRERGGRSHLSWVWSHFQMTHSFLRALLVAYSLPTVSVAGISTEMMSYDIIVHFAAASHDQRQFLVIVFIINLTVPFYKNVSI